MQLNSHPRSGCLHERASRVRFTVVALLGLLVLSGARAWSHEFTVGNLVIDHPWSRATPPGAKVGGAYFTVKNNGKDADTLISATAGIAERAEFHRMAMNGDVMTMSKVEEPVTVSPGETVAFEPGGLHLMLFALEQQLKEGGSFTGTLTFEKAGTVQLSFEVDKLGVRAPSGGSTDHPAVQPN